MKMKQNNKIIYNTGEYIMAERRINWKENVGEAARERAKRRHQIIIDIDEIREQLQKVDFRSSEYDNLIARKRELAAQLATI
jgi:hypothetical protein